tara:strand:- start:2588 stop:2797 length:210 start_codon:yes stop_codon:yes gene_type:complete
MKLPFGISSKMLTSCFGKVVIKNGWIKSTYKGKSIRFKNTPETHRIIQKGGILNNAATVKKLKSKGLLK